MTSNSKNRTDRKAQKSTKRQKTIYRKESLENVHLHQTKLNKTITIQQYWVKYDFRAPLKCYMKVPQSKHQNDALSLSSLSSALKISTF